MHVQAYTRPGRRQDLAFAARFLHAYERDGTFVADGVDLLADDLASRGYVVAALTTVCRALVERERSAHWAYLVPEHFSLERILRAEIAELYVRLDLLAAALCTDRATGRAA